jgi:hypothetical protein
MRKILFLAAGAALLGLTGCSSAEAGQPMPASTTAWTPSTAVEATPEPTPLDLDDFITTLKVTDKQCFGDVGCTVTVEPTLEYVHSLDTLENRSFSVTLTITGDESGPVITTIDGTGDSYNVTPVLMSTRGSSVVPKAKITDVQEY